MAAGRCTGDSPRVVWSERLLKLYEADDHGAREKLLHHADLLLDKPAQHGLVARYELQLTLALDASSPGGRLPVGVFPIWGVLSLLAESLRPQTSRFARRCASARAPTPCRRSSPTSISLH